MFDVVFLCIRRIRISTHTVVSVDRELSTTKKTAKQRRSQAAYEIPVRWLCGWNSAAGAAILVSVFLFFVFFLPVHFSFSSLLYRGFLRLILRDSGFCCCCCCFLMPSLFVHIFCSFMFCCSLWSRCWRVHSKCVWRWMLVFRTFVDGLCSDVIP